MLAIINHFFQYHTIEIVKDVYRAILNAIDTKEIDSGEDILVVKRRFFTESYNKAIEEFANTWFVEENELHLSAIQYVNRNRPYSEY